MNISDSPEITLTSNTIGITVHFGEHGMALLHKIGQVLTTDLTKDLKFKKNHAEDLKQTTFIDQLKKRRSIYVLGKRVHLSQVYLAELIQYAVWTCLVDAGLGASLQHYNPSIDADISKVFEIPKHWRLRAQLVFGSIEEKAAEKEHHKDEERFMIYA